MSAAVFLLFFGCDTICDKFESYYVMIFVLLKKNKTIVCDCLIFRER